MAGLIDQTPIIIARTRNEDRFVGSTPSADFLEAAATADEGSWRTINLEGQPTYSGWTRSAITGWIVGIGLPAETVEGPMRRSLQAMTVAGILISLFGSIGVLNRHFAKKAVWK